MNSANSSLFSVWNAFSVTQSTERSTCNLACSLSPQQWATHTAASKEGHSILLLKQTPATHRIPSPNLQMPEHREGEAKIE